MSRRRGLKGAIGTPMGIIYPRRKKTLSERERVRRGIDCAQGSELRIIRDQTIIGNDDETKKEDS